MGVREEILEQPAVLGRTIRATTELVPALADWLGQHDIHQVVLAARGTSDNAARFAQYLWTRTCHLPVMLAQPSSFVPARAPVLRGALVVGISQSGQSPDLVQVVAEGRRAGCPTLVVTNDPASPLGAAGEFCVPLHAGVERAVAATKTYTAQLAALAAITGALPGGGDGRVHETLGAVPDLVAATLAADSQVDPLAELLDGEDRCGIVGRGLDLATAHEWALKLQELAGVLGHAWSAADFRHGPFALAARGLPLLLVSTDPFHAVEHSELAADLRARGAPVGAITDHDGMPAGVRTFRVPAGGELGGVFTAAVAAQLVTVAVAVRQGFDPDAPQGIEKVTRTR